jgi:hypothetical protein
MDPHERLLNILARTVGLFGNRGWPYIEIMTDDDEKRSYPITDDGAAVIGYARKLLAEHDRKPIAMAGCPQERKREE